MRKRMSMREVKKSIISGKGKDFSAVALQMEGYLSNWLNASGVSEEEFFNILNRNDFYIMFSCDKEEAFILIYNIDGEIVAPLVWQSEGRVKFETFRIDAALLLMMVAAKCSNPAVKEKIEGFVREEMYEKR